jgi:hypothetical protein
MCRQKIYGSTIHDHEYYEKLMLSPLPLFTLILIHKKMKIFSTDNKQQKDDENYQYQMMMMIMLMMMMVKR